MPSPAVILVVDDEEGVRRLACQMLDREGYHTLEAGDGQEALEVMDAAGGAVSMVISDIRMPRLNGVELGCIVRERWPAIPVILISGEVTREWVVRAVRENSMVVLRKPFLREDLVEMVQELLRARAG